MQHLGLCSLVSHHSCVANRVVMTSEKHLCDTGNLRLSKLEGAADTRSLSLIELCSISSLSTRKAREPTVQASRSLKISTSP